MAKTGKLEGIGIVDNDDGPITQSNPFDPPAKLLEPQWMLAMAPAYSFAFFGAVAAKGSAGKTMRKNATYDYMQRFKQGELLMLEEAEANKVLARWGFANEEIPNHYIRSEDEDQHERRRSKAYEKISK